ncbi:MAG: SurA N-terminal domain-containing protein [Proteobacteria bacterium]|nr:SurA N-terminal domain-containing protein [Pseudomonadota bacterium]
MGTGRKNKLIYIFLFVFLPSLVMGETIDKIVAIVGDTPITLTNLRKFLKLKSNNELVKLPNIEKDRALDMLIEKELIEQKAKKLGIGVSDKEIDEEIENVKKINNITTEILELALQKEGMTLSEYKEIVRFQILKAKVVNREVRPFVVVTDEILMNYYQTEIASGLEKVVSFRVLTFYENQKNKLERDIKDYYNMAQKGVSFEEIVKKASEKYNVTDTTSENVKLKTLSIELQEAIGNMKPPQLGPLVKFDMGFQIFKLNSLKHEGLKPFEEIKEDLKKQYQKDKMEQIYKKWLEDLKKEIYVEKRL